MYFVAARRTGPLLVLACLATAVGAAWAGGSAQTARSPVLDSIQRGTDAAGRAVARADAATRRGIARGSEKASAGPRRVGESLGRKLPGRSGKASPPKVGPQASPP